MTTTEKIIIKFLAKWYSPQGSITVKSLPKEIYWIPDNDELCPGCSKIKKINIHKHCRTSKHILNKFKENPEYVYKNLGKVPISQELIQLICETKLIPFKEAPLYLNHSISLIRDAAKLILTHIPEEVL